MRADALLLDDRQTRRTHLRASQWRWHTDARGRRNHCLNAQAAGTTAPADTDGISILPELTGGKQAQHDYLYWEISGWTAIRQGNWRAVQPKPNKPWELYDLASDPSESKDLSAAKPDVLAKLTTLAAKAHEPVREGSFTTTVRHDRDRRAKFGKQDEPEAPPAKKAKGKAANVMPTEGLLPNKGWKVIRVSSENSGNEPRDSRASREGGQVAGTRGPA